MRSDWFVRYKLAHRGLHNEKYPENSLGAFENAISHDFAIELDVRVTKDNQLVIFHDSNLQRMCGVHKNISDLTLNEIKELRLLNTNYSIPTLQEVLDLTKGKTPIMIELKPVSRKFKITNRVYEAIKDYKGDIAVKAFNPLYMLWFKKHARHIIRGMLSSYFEHTKMPFVYKFLIKKLTFFNLIKPDFISYDINNLPNKYTRHKNVPILAWTIYDENQEKQALKVADNVIFQDYIPNKIIKK